MDLPRPGSWTPRAPRTPRTPSAATSRSSSKLPRRAMCCALARCSWLWRSSSFRAVELARASPRGSRPCGRRPAPPRRSRRVRRLPNTRAERRRSDAVHRRPLHLPDRAHQAPRQAVQAASATASASASRQRELRSRAHEGGALGLRGCGDEQRHAVRRGSEPRARPRPPADGVDGAPRAAEGGPALRASRRPRARRRPARRPRGPPCGAARAPPRRGPRAAPRGAAPRPPARRARARARRSGSAPRPRHPRRRPARPARARAARPRRSASVGASASSRAARSWGVPETVR